VRQRLTLVALSDQEYVAAFEETADVGVSGGGVYDAIIGRCAIKAKAGAIYTWKTTHFTRLGKAVAARVKTPEQGAART
jgi:hypothetical protein